MAAAPKLPDLDALALERVQLQRRLAEITRRHERLQERVALYPTEVSVMQERRCAAELAAVNQRIEEIDATLIPLRLRPLGLE